MGFNIIVRMYGRKSTGIAFAFSSSTSYGHTNAEKTYRKVSKYLR